MSVNLKSLIGRLNDTCRQALEGAAGLCLSRTNYDVEVEHVLLKLLEAPDTDLVRYLAGLEFDYDVQLVLRKDEVPPCSLDSKSALPPMLGWTTWVTSETPRKDADEVVLPVDN